MNINFNSEDAGQIVIGAFALSVPIAFSEESWHLAQTLPLGNMALVVLLSLGFIALFAYQSVFQANVMRRIGVFWLRVAIAYLLTLAVVSVVLIALDKWPMLHQPILALKRTLLIAMPASMGAIIVDSFDKE
ncbi:hypothetical protein HR45_00745 [Shewanella mangrovi]|uniref:Integral membrane protein n=1 Tax=Shewanella mangrovi TaxID=1515746 RepID=A0A094LUR7_9GAMM|nr:DUF2391 family protein [Shewanella mangrovi]KFZ38963.1 hypothetical protein HR45_00745 [Shewanella mangrovi]